MRYEIIRRQSAKELVDAVNSYLNVGWQVTGGVCMDIPDDGGEGLWAQAIFKPSPVSEPDER